MLATRKEILQAAQQLTGALTDRYDDQKGRDWTKDVFARLRSFCQKELALNPDASCFHKHHPLGRTEFLWDFLATDQSNAVLLVAESEQSSLSEGPTQNLKHDFEKLLYVYTPLRLLVCKAKDDDDVVRLVKKLEEYMAFATLNPGSVFLLHFCTWYGGPMRTFLWQSDGDPVPRKAEKLNFVSWSAAHS